MTKSPGPESRRENRAGSLKSSIVAASFDYEAGATIAPHRHDSHQLVYAARGVMRVQAANGTWVVPPNRALWVPAGIEHEIRAIGSVQMRTLYMQPNDSQNLLGQNDCAVVAVAPLLRELILRLIDIQNTARGRVGEEHIVALILDEIKLLEVQPLHLPLPAELPLRRLCEEFQSDPGAERTSTEWSSRYGMSVKTMERAFVKNVGMTFGQWKQQVRLLAGLERLAGGEPIMAVALDLGYKSPSSFAAMFRKALGSAPSKYFR